MSLNHFLYFNFMIVILLFHYRYMMRWVYQVSPFVGRHALSHPVLSTVLARNARRAYLKTDQDQPFHRFLVNYSHRHHRYYRDAISHLHRFMIAWGHRPRSLSEMKTKNIIYVIQICLLFLLPIMAWGFIPEGSIGYAALWFNVICLVLTAFHIINHLCWYGIYGEPDIYEKLDEKYDAHLNTIYKDRGTDNFQVGVYQHHAFMSYITTYINAVVDFDPKKEKHGRDLLKTATLNRVISFIAILPYFLSGIPNYRKPRMDWHALYQIRDIVSIAMGYMMPSMIGLLFGLSVAVIIF